MLGGHGPPLYHDLASLPRGDKRAPPSLVAGRVGELRCADGAGAQGAGTC